MYWRAVTQAGGGRAILEHLGTAHAASEAGPGAGATAAGVVLSPKQQLPRGHQSCSRAMKSAKLLAMEWMSPSTVTRAILGWLGNSL